MPYHLWKEDGIWVAKDMITGVASQGETHEKALENLEEAVNLHEGEESSDQKGEDRFLKDLGINPAEVKKAREENRNLPSFMR